MMIALNAKNKLKIVTGALNEPSVDSEERAMWERTNDMIISWILNTISDQISNNLNFVNSASALWSELHEHCAQLDGPRIYQLPISPASPTDSEYLRSGMRYMIHNEVACLMLGSMTPEL
ncbi:hypothetical protein Tco_0803154 [Tanacetum coccineum]|uniref:Retrotransposon Copia-like N-terminal domain-containing protein n=1 Tax=Tanacetum coccineum TaxID=301880 RepID=A0ABQ5A3J9_9ASTR